MPSPFDAFNARLSGAILSAFGEECAQLRPRVRSEFAEGADPARPARPIRGVFTEGHDDPAIRGAAMGAEFSGVSRLSVHIAEFWVPASEVSAAPYQIKKGDCIALPARKGAPVYEISDIQISEAGGLNLILVQGQE
jgi:hypothetical protein